MFTGICVFFSAKLLPYWKMQGKTQNGRGFIEYIYRKANLFLKIQ